MISRHKLVMMIMNLYMYFHNIFPYICRNNNIRHRAYFFFAKCKIRKKK